jgi:hypothetical protein
MLYYLEKSSDHDTSAEKGKGAIFVYESWKKQDY